MTRNKLLMTCAVASLALGLSACSSDDDAPVMMTSMMDQEPALTPAEMLVAAQSSFDAAQEAVDNLAADATPEEIAAAETELVAAQLALILAANLPENQPPPLTEIQVAQAAAADAAAAAMTAAGAAGDAADDADTARVNIATMQTGETGKTSGGHAYMARHYADEAEAERVKAETASAAAAAAEDIATATRALVNAEEALLAAKDAADKAAIHAGLAMDATDNELFIDGTVKTVGGTSINANAGALTEDVGSQTKKTGLIEIKNPSARMVGGKDEVNMVDDDTNTMDVDETVHPQPEVMARTFDIGKTIDSPDDMARLMIVTSYAGSKQAGVFVQPSADDADLEMGTREGYVTITDNDDETDDDNNTALRSAGMYYLATNAGAADDADDRNVATLEVGTVADDAKTEQVYYYITPGVEGADDVRNHFVLVSEDKDRVSGITTYSYQPVTVGMEKVKIFEATDYKHIHFGVWADLGDAAEDGTQSTLADLGIGFVQNFSDSPTGDDMPNVGMATYNGNWAAAVQEADDEGNGDITLENGAASLTAYFETGKITAALTDLATLTGKIDEDKFSGDTASDINAMHGLDDADVDFEGTFNGAFYGTKAAEAAGIFDFAAANDEGENVGGAFRGAFGADKK